MFSFQLFGGSSKKFFLEVDVLLGVLRHSGDVSSTQEGWDRGLVGDYPRFWKVLHRLCRSRSLQRKAYLFAAFSRSNYKIDTFLHVGNHVWKPVRTQTSQFFFISLQHKFYVAFFCVKGPRGRGALRRPAHARRGTPGPQRGRLLPRGCGAAKE